MNLRRMTNAIVLILGISITLGQSALAQTRLGLFVTQEELVIWKERAKNGPYKTKGDAGPNSPDDWMRIQRNANAFLQKPSADRVKGQSANTCIQGENPGDPKIYYANKVNAGVKMRDAAFYYLITGNTQYVTAAKKELLAQIQEPGVNFRDKKRFCKDHWSWADDSYLKYPAWLSKMTLTYDFIKDTLSASEKGEIEAWLQGAADYFEYWTVNTYILNHWPNRNSFTKDTDYYESKNKQQRVLFYTDPQGKNAGGRGSSVSTAYKNVQATSMQPVCMIAVLLKDSRLKESCKKYFRELIMFSIYPQGAVSDMMRSDTAGRGQDTLFYYGVAIIDTAVLIADVFARNGDPSLYEYKTTWGGVRSKGIDQLSGQPKSLFQTLRWFGAYMDGTVGNKRYHRGGKEKNNQFFPIVNSRALYNDVYFSAANVYYRDDYIRGTYTRTRRGTPTYRAQPEGGSGESAWGGYQGLFPGALFMFGQMEGKIWPYPSSAPLVSTPTRLRIVKD